MDLRDWQRVKDVFQRAVDLPGEGRARSIAEALKDAPQLRVEVEKLLSIHDRSDGVFMRPPPTHSVAQCLAEETDEDLVGQTLGPYRIEQLIASGGMGRVYRAHRADGEFDKQVALKVIRRRPDGDRLLRRFLTERQTLASLQHPNIVALLDAGTTPDGRPYLVMDYVQGEPIDQYVAHHPTPIRDRLELFLQVCAAVEHAHQHLIVHRDIKPSNVLVTPSGQVRLLDFGIAKHVSVSSASAAETAPVDQTLMTFEYASPEQLRQERVTTASDVYSLGVILYEMLTGQSPYRFGSRLRTDMERIICDVEPERPSTAFRRAGATAVLDGRRGRERAAGAEAAGRRIGKDLDNIVMKTLRKEPQRRYSSVEQLADDLRAYLDNRPVRARPNTARYRVAKFVARNRLAAALAGLAGLALLSGVIGVAWQAHLASRQRDRALRALQHAERVTTFLTDMLGSADPAADGPEVRVRDVLDRACDKLTQEPALDPGVAADVMATLGATYAALGLYDQAERVLRRALDLQSSLHGAESLEAAKVLCDLSLPLYSSAKYAEAQRALEASLRIQERMADAARQDLLALTLNNLGAVLKAQGQVQAAEPLYRRALDLRERVCGSDSVEVAETLNNLAGLLRVDQRLDEAETLAVRALDIRSAKLRPDHPLVLQSLENVAVLRLQRGSLPEARSMMEDLASRLRRVLGEGHPDLATTLSNLASVLRLQQDFSGADPLLAESFHIRRKAFGDGHGQTALAACLYAANLTELGRYGEARSLFEANFPKAETSLGATHPKVVTFRQAFERVRDQSMEEAASLPDS